MTLFKSVGKLHYERVGDSFKLIVEADPGIALFYKSLIPKWFDVKPQRYLPHISVVRKEIPPKIAMWGLHEGEKIEFLYDTDIKYDDRYWWLNIFSKHLEEIRVELGLKISSPYTLPPSGFINCFHMTIGNTKQST